MPKWRFCACLQIVSFNRYGKLVTPNITRANRFLTILGCSLNTLSNQRKRKKSLSVSFIAICRKAFSMSGASAMLNVRKRSRISNISGVV